MVRDGTRTFVPGGKPLLRLRRGIRSIFLFALLALPAAGAVAPAQAAMEDSALCRDAIAGAEAGYDIPSQLLMAVALVETGRWDEATQRVVPWPWTVYAQGKGRYFSTAAQAAAEVERLRAAGVRNIDVGCMQVNLHYHPDAFADLDAAFDPASNVAYAATFLADLYAAKRSWAGAVAFYHSATPQYAKPYRKKVIEAWNDERRRVAEEKRQRRIETLKAEREERAREAAARDS